MKGGEDMGIVADVCMTCGTPLESATVNHPVPGHGSVRAEEKKHCPKCDEKPNK